MGRIQRHFTLNIDGLAEAVGMGTWHHEKNPDGITVEMHGNIRQLVCPSCHSVEPLSDDSITALKAKEPIRCQKCSEDSLRFKVMLYDDAEGDCITPEASESLKPGTFTSRECLTLLWARRESSIAWRRI